MSSPRLAPSPATARGHVPDDLLSFVLDVERLPPTAAGAFVFEDEDGPCGAVYVDARRVCLAIDHRAPGRLREMLRPDNLRSRSSTMRALLETVRSPDDVLRMYQRGHPALRPVLLEHNCDAILGLLRSPVVGPTWTPRTRAYAAKLSFDSAELLAGLCRARAGLEPASDVIRAGLHGSISAIAMSAEASGSWLCDARDDLGIGVAALLELGRWAERALGHAEGTVPGLEIVLVEGAGHSTLAWREAQLRLGALCADPQASLQVIRNHVRGGSRPPRPTRGASKT